MNELKQLQAKLQTFADERDWDKFHSPKNLVMALSVEVGELVEHFQWLTESESKTLSPNQRAEVSEELADVFMYLLRIADKTEVDLINACANKIQINRRKYPIDKSYGVSTKYTKL